LTRSFFVPPRDVRTSADVKCASIFSRNFAAWARCAGGYPAPFRCGLVAVALLREELYTRLHTRRPVAFLRTLSGLFCRGWETFCNANVVQTLILATYSPLREDARATRYPILDIVDNRIAFCRRSDSRFVSRGAENHYDRPLVLQHASFAARCAAS
jgi:hypothetical protein